jgi:hypothetical protein
MTESVFPYGWELATVQGEEKGEGKEGGGGKGKGERERERESEGERERERERESEKGLFLATPTRVSQSLLLASEQFWFQAVVL